MFAPIAYMENNTLTGFDVNLAEAVVDYLNETYGSAVEIQWVEIDWATKQTQLENGTLDLVWNGMTLTDEVMNGMSTTVPYLANRQTLIIRSADAEKYGDMRSFFIAGKGRGRRGRKRFRRRPFDEHRVTCSPKFLKDSPKVSAYTVGLFAVTLVAAIPLGIIVALCSITKFKPIRWLTKVFIWVVRGTPLLLQIIVVTFIPSTVFLLANKDLADFFGVSIVGLNFIFAAVAFIINYSAYFAEIFRGGIEGIPRGQHEAAQVLGMKRGQTFFRIILPQVVKRILAPISNEVITLVKDTSLARVIGVTELFMVAYNVVTTEAIIWPLFFAGLYYLLFNGILTILFHAAEKKLSYYKV